MQVSRTQKAHCISCAQQHRRNK